tara:strand:+ start:231 stop:878 length:648 start_codon:yes stop_codon:yes gene_type:complete
MTDKKDEAIKVIRPFGPSIARIKMPDTLVENLNSYIDEIISNKNKIEQLNHGHKLAGNVTQELKLENDLITSSGFQKFLASSVSSWIKLSENKDIKEFKLIRSWVVRQFQNEYNPVHWHGGHVSGVGYLKVPSTYGKGFQEKEKGHNNGQIDLIHGSRQFLSASDFLITPEVGYFYLFPHYLMHTVYPFNSTKEERRSVSFNALIDEKIFNVYSN